MIKEYVYGIGIDEVLTMKVGATTYYYHENTAGSIYAITDSSGDIVESYSYSDYGEATIYDSTGTQVSQSTIGNQKMFTGRDYDSETGLYYYRARHYSAVLGRFLQRDPLESDELFNSYTYVNNNPLNYIDPYGLEAKQIKDQSVVYDLNLIRKEIEGVQGSIDYIIDEIAAGEYSWYEYEMGKKRRGIVTIGYGVTGALNRYTRPDYFNKAIDEIEKDWKLMPGRYGMTYVVGGFAAFADIVTFRGTEQAARDWLTAHLLQEWGVHVMYLDKLRTLEKKAIQQAKRSKEK